MKTDLGVEASLRRSSMDRLREEDPVVVGIVKYESGIGAFFSFTGENTSSLVATSRALGRVEGS